jgi:hypothetical protein
MGCVMLLWIAVDLDYIYHLSLRPQQDSVYGSKIKLKPAAIGTTGFSQGKIESISAHHMIFVPDTVILVTIYGTQHYLGDSSIFRHVGLFIQ